MVNRELGGKQETSGEQETDAEQNGWAAMADWAKEHPFGSQAKEVTHGDSTTSENTNEAPALKKIEYETVATSDLDVNSDVIDRGITHLGEPIIVKPEDPDHKMAREELVGLAQEESNKDTRMTYYMRAQMRGDADEWDFSEMSEEEKAEAERQKRFAEMGSPNVAPFDYHRADYDEKIDGPLEELEDKRTYEELSESEKIWQDSYDNLIAGEAIFDQDVMSVMKEQNPDVFRPSKELLNERIGDVLESLKTEENQKAIMDIAKVYAEGDSKAAATQALEFFGQLYGLKNYPQVRFFETTDSLGGVQINDTNDIIINLNKGKKRLKPEDFMDFMAHELWHARQAQAIEDREPHWRKLVTNTMNYLEPTDNPTGTVAGESKARRDYRKQILEAEAWAIGGTVKKMVKRKMPLGQRLKFAFSTSKKEEF